MARPEYSSYYLNKDGSEKALDVAEAFSKLVDYLEQVAPPCREVSIGKTKLEEACMFFRKAVAMQPENQHGYVPDGTAPTEAS